MPDTKRKLMTQDTSHKCTTIQVSKKNTTCILLSKLMKIGKIKSVFANSPTCAKSYNGDEFNF